MTNTRLLQQCSTGQTEEWSRFWQRDRKGLIIRSGRGVYNTLFLRALLPHVSSDTTLLELGCGTASLGMTLAPSIATYTGIDAVESAIQIARQTAQERRRTNMRFVHGDIYDQNLDLGASSFDIVWSQGLIEHFTDPSDVISRHLQHCRPGGKVLLSVPKQHSYHHVWYALSDYLQMPSLWPWTPQRFFSKESLRASIDTVAHRPFKDVVIHDLFPAGSGILIAVIQT